MDRIRSCISKSWNVAVEFIAHFQAWVSLTCSLRPESIVWTFLEQSMTKLRARLGFTFWRSWGTRSSSGRRETAQPSMVQPSCRIPKDFWLSSEAPSAWRTWCCCTPPRFLRPHFACKMKWKYCRKHESCWQHIWNSLALVSTAIKSWMKLAYHCQTCKHEMTLEGSYNMPLIINCT